MCAAQPDLAAPRQFIIDKPSFKKEYGISPRHNPSYRQYVRLRVAATSSYPDLTLHDGVNAQAPVVGVAYIVKFKVGFKIGLGDPTNVSSMIWEDLKSENKLNSAFGWSMELPLPQDSVTDSTNWAACERRSFMWKRTRRVAVDGVSIHAISMRNWKLVDDEGKLVAVFTNNISRGQAGTLQMNVDLGDAFEKMALMTLLAVYERMRRQ
ncbi:hypothetical protein QQS21_007817 [Conoideocrella luteorostrata]|uniref:Uncharacterized protein n=1 Tax=Conoideocrella luteorostrata TaxID=1105319 RepID=A0AAJ0CK00_9HYPO|nr:hypothetical protein QQS21_007817 [Conoideocrella luteorostrata]